MGRFRSWLTRDTKPTDVVMAIAALLLALGFTVSTPAQGAKLLAARVSVTETRLDRLESKVEFNSYLQCVQFRRSDPTMLPTGCAPIILNQERGR